MSHVFYLDLNDDRIQQLKQHTSESGSDCLRLYGSIILYKSEASGAAEAVGAVRDQICFLAVPNDLTMEALLEGIVSLSDVNNAFRVIDAKTGQNSLFLTLIDAESAAKVHQKWNGREGWPSRHRNEMCHVVFVSELHIGADNFDSTDLIELPTCPVCLERLDLRISGVFGHSHVGSTICRCIDLWEDIDCYVCRLLTNRHKNISNVHTPAASPRVSYPSPRVHPIPNGLPFPPIICPTVSSDPGQAFSPVMKKYDSGKVLSPMMKKKKSDPTKAFSPVMKPKISDPELMTPPAHFRRSSTPIPGSVCHAANCTVNENLWICLHCGLLSCGRYHNQHAVMHYEEFPNHRFCADILKLYLWDYKGDAFVHRIYSQADASFGRHLLQIASDEDICRTVEDDQDHELMQAKVSTMTEYYNNLLTDALSRQQSFYEEKLTKEQEHFERELQKLDFEKEELKQHVELIKLAETQKKLREDYLQLLEKKRYQKKQMARLEKEHSTQIKKVLEDKRIKAQRLEAEIGEMMGNFQ